MLLTFVFISTNVLQQQENHFKKMVKYSRQKLLSPSNGGQGKLQLPALVAAKYTCKDCN